MNPIRFMSRLGTKVSTIFFALGLASLGLTDAGGEEPVTFSKHVAPILQQHCQSCHRPGEGVPMTLMDYESTRPYAKSIKKVVSEKSMPPWHADPNHGTFANDRRMSEKEIATIIGWIDAGAPEGNPADLPPLLQFLEGWNIGKPDLVLTMEKPFNVPAEGIIDYQNIALPPFPEDRWVQKIEIRPSNRKVAHHINVFVQKPGAQEGKRGAKEFVTGFVPGGISTEFPEGTAIMFKKGTRVILQAHYVTVGEPQSDQTSVGFVFARKPVEKAVNISLISNYTFRIPPNDPNFEVRARWKYSEPITLIGTMVHMHLRGKDYKFVGHYPDGREEVLMSVPKYDFEWQMGYHFKERPKLPAGSSIEGIAHMDNSSGNPFNPDPNATVTYGPQTYDEMIMGFVFYTKDNENLADNIGKENLGPLSSEVGEAVKEGTAAGAGN